MTERAYSSLAMRIGATGIAVALVLMTVAGCTAEPKPTASVDPNAVPAKYRDQIATYLLTQLTDREDYRGALIGVPTLKPVGSSQRIVVCVQLNGHNRRNDKVVIYFAGMITQFLDSKPEQCADAAYQPFQELAAMMPR
jgi:hypothetical protein